MSEAARDGRKEYLPLPWFDDDVLAELFRHEVFAMLLQHQRIQTTTIETMLSWRFHSGFSVHSQTRLSSHDRRGMEQVARYIARNPFDQEQVEINELGMVALQHRGKSSPSGQDQEILHPLEFLARACQQIPDPYEPRVFFYGLAWVSHNQTDLGSLSETPSQNAQEFRRETLDSSKSRGIERRAKKRPADPETEGSPDPAPPPDLDSGQPDTPFRRQGRKRWAELIRKVWLDDPMVCQCGGAMRILAFITDPPIVDKIINHLGLDHPDPPEPIAHAPPIDSLGTF